MKVIVAFCFLFAVATADWVPKTNEELLKIRADCINWEKVSDANLEKIKNSDLADEPEVRCYIRCMVSNIGTWDDVNGFNIDRGFQQLEKSGHTVTKENLTKCFTANTKNVDKCTWAYGGFKCLYDNKYITKSLISKS